MEQIGDVGKSTNRDFEISHIYRNGTNEIRGEWGKWGEVLKKVGKMVGLVG